jgi:hypothetical protein
MYVGKSNIFGLWGDFFDRPIFVYCFNDQKRFLCDFDYDVEDFVFVIDMNKGSASVPQPKWPANDFNRQQMSSWMTNVVLEARGTVRFPTFAELQEASTNVSRLAAGQFLTTFGRANRLYWLKASLIADLKTNREY